MQEYKQKFNSMFSLLAAVTDEINQLKKREKFQALQISEEDAEDSEYENESESESESVSENEDDGENSSENAVKHSEDEENDEGEEEEEEEEEDIVSAPIAEELQEKKIIIHDGEPDYNNMSVKELRMHAKEKGLGGDNITKLKKQDLIELLNENTLKIE